MNAVEFQNGVSNVFRTEVEVEVEVEFMLALVVFK
jgi:hypothetical protein